MAKKDIFYIDAFTNCLIPNTEKDVDSSVTIKKGDWKKTHTEIMKAIRV